MRHQHINVIKSGKWPHISLYTVLDS